MENVLQGVGQFGMKALAAKKHTKGDNLAAFELAMASWKLRMYL